MLAGLSAKILQNGEGMEYLLSLVIAAIKFYYGNDISGETSHVLGNLKLGLARLLCSV